MSEATNHVPVLDCYQDENLDKTFGGKVLAALRQIPAEWRQSCAAHVGSLTTRTEWRETGSGLQMAVLVPTGVAPRQEWVETVAAFKDGWRPVRMEGMIRTPEETP